MPPSKKTLNILGFELIEARIITKNGKYYVYSQDGKKKLGGPYSSKELAIKRLKEVEYFKHQGKANENKS